MKFKINKGTELFEKFQQLKQDIQRVNKEATKLVESFGYTRYCIAPHCLAGGIGAIEILSVPLNDRKKWVRVSKQNSQLWMPRQNRENAELIDEIKRLPKLDYAELNDLIGFKAGATNSFGWATHPGVIWRDEYILIEMADGQIYEPCDGMVEILTSEYQRLKNQVATPQ